MYLSCFHCGENVPPGASFNTDVDGASQVFCCLGCQQIAQVINDQGLLDYYRFRTEKASKAAALVPEELAIIKSYDEQIIQQDFVQQHANVSSALLSINGITCAACAWLIERTLHALVLQVDVNTATSRAMVKWDNSQHRLSEIITALAQLGYKAYPFQTDEEEKLKQQTAKSYLRRLGVAGLMSMQVMMFATAMYFGLFTGIDEEIEQYFRFISMALATPVILYSALPFLHNAIVGLRARQLVMDLPVSLAIFGAYIASVYATLTQSGEVYFESITMFTFLLLLGKYLEFRARLKASESITNLQKLQPVTATRIEQENHVTVAAKQLRVGDLILVRAGDIIPADAIVVTGNTSCDESMMTGEYLPVTKLPQDAIYAGTVNHDGVITAKVSNVGAQTLLNQIIRLQYEALSFRPKIQEVTDRIAQYFVAALLVCAALVAAYWYPISPSQAFWTTVVVLVATCPCALSLAVPMALTCSVASLTKKGILIKSAHTLETAVKLTTFAFDKTGTLTHGRFQLQSVKNYHASLTDQDLLNLVANLEKYSEHPIAHAFAPYFVVSEPLVDVTVSVGQGISALWHQQQVSVGRPDWYGRNTEPAQVSLFIDEKRVADFVLSDGIREEAPAVIAALQAQGLATLLVTGDSSIAAQHCADTLNISEVHQGQSPQAKQQVIEQKVQQGAVVAMVGDGVNDSPVFNSAHLSVAMSSGADISKNAADVVLLNNNLQSLNSLLHTAQKTRRIIKQNLALSLLYNASVLPLAAAGLIAPYIAVVGMTTSSLIVIANSLRLLKLK